LITQVYALLRRVLRNGNEFPIQQEHWKSKTRNLVRRHLDEYAEWPEWTETETADLVFPDRKGALTDLLIENGYLEYSDWHDQAPDYLIEVKSTMSNRNNEFYMSSHQYTRVRTTFTVLALVVHSKPGGTELTFVYRVIDAGPLQLLRTTLNNLHDCSCHQPSRVQNRLTALLRPLQPGVETQVQAGLGR
jgi:hypothetical protein